MIANLLLFFFSFGLLIFGANLLVSGSARLASRLGVSPLVIGLTIVAIGTSAPELLVSLNATFTGHPDIAFGNVVGSNIFNIAIILGLAALISPFQVDRQIFRVDAPVMLGATVLAFVFLGDRLYGFWEGVTFIAILILYVTYSLCTARRGNETVTAQDSAKGEPDHAITPREEHKKPAWFLLILITAGFALLLAGSDLLVNSSTRLAQLLGVSDAIIALTIVAAGTSLPELAASVVAARKGQPEICLGNIIGSNIFNLAGILGVCGLVNVSAPLSVSVSFLDLGFMTGLTALLLPFAFTGQKLVRWEGVVLISIYVIYVIFLWPTTG